MELAGSTPPNPIAPPVAAPGSLVPTAPAVDAGLAEDIAPPEQHVTDRGVKWVISMPFFAAHVFAVVGLIMVGFSWWGLGLAAALYVIRMFGITAGYHRYFSHRTYKMGRGMQFFMAFLGATAAQKGVLWWAAHHRRHHKLSDLPGDVHSKKLDGFWHSHVGWILSEQHHKTDWPRIKDFAKYPELRFINRFHLLPPLALLAILFGVFGFAAGVWAVVSTVALWHGTFTINSLSHMWGSRRYETTDDSRNNPVLAIITLGEGWHNNHHYYQRATNQGFFWWEIDVSYYVLKVLSWVGLVSDLTKPPEHIRRAVKKHSAAQA